MRRRSFGALVILLMQVSTFSCISGGRRRCEWWLFFATQWPTDCSSSRLKCTDTLKSTSNTADEWMTLNLGRAAATPPPAGSAGISLRRARWEKYATRITVNYWRFRSDRWWWRGGLEGKMMYLTMPSSGARASSGAHHPSPCGRQQRLPARYPVRSFLRNPERKNYANVNGSHADS